MVVNVKVNRNINIEHHAVIIFNPLPQFRIQRMWIRIHINLVTFRFMTSIYTLSLFLSPFKSSYSLEFWLGLEILQKCLYLLSIRNNMCMSNKSLLFKFPSHQVIYGESMSQRMNTFGFSLSGGKVRKESLVIYMCRYKECNAFVCTRIWMAIHTQIC